MLTYFLAHCVLLKKIFIVVSLSSQLSLEEIKRASYINIFFVHGSCLFLSPFVQDKKISSFLKTQNLIKALFFLFLFWANIVNKFYAHIKQFSFTDDHDDNIISELKCGRVLAALSKKWVMQKQCGEYCTLCLGITSN